jgi:Protein of unknown function (DUF3352)
MRRALLLIAVVACVLAGCGSSAKPAASPISTELSYFPSNSPFVMTVVTAPGSAAVKQAQGLVGTFPGGSLGEAALMSKLQQIGINYDADIRPLFGNPVAFGIAGDGLAGRARNQFLVAWITKDSATLSSLVKKIFHSAPSAGTHNGATLYQLGSEALAIKGPTLLLGSSTAILDGALDRHANGSGISQSQYSRDVSGLPQNTLMQTFGSLSGVLSKPPAAKARRVPWVAALRGYAAAITANSSGLTLQYRLDTSRAPLTSPQLPIAEGTSAPGLAGTEPIVGAVKDPAQTISFIEAAEQLTSPSQYAAFQKRQADLQRKTGVSLNSLLSMLTGDLIVQSYRHKTMGRAVLSDPAGATRTLAKLASEPKAVFSHATSVRSLGGGFYEIKESGTAITLGVVGNQLVVGSTTSAALRAFASAPVTVAAGAQGTVAYRIALPTLVKLAIKQAPSPIARMILGSLGEITGWTAASTSGLTGSATVAVK